MTVREEVAELKGTSNERCCGSHSVNSAAALQRQAARRELRQMLSGMSDWYHMGFFLLDGHARLLVLVRTD